MACGVVGVVAKAPPAKEHAEAHPAPEKEAVKEVQKADQPVKVVPAVVAPQPLHQSLPL